MSNCEGTSTGQHQSTVNAVFTGKHVPRSNGVHSSAGRIETYRSGSITRHVNVSNDDGSRLHPSYRHPLTAVTSPPFAFTSTPAPVTGTPLAYMHGGVTGPQSSSGGESRRLRCQSAASSQQSSLGAPSTAAVYFSIEATRAAALNLQRQEEMWSNEWSQLRAEAQQTQQLQVFDKDKTEQDAASVALQLPIHHPDFDLDTFLNSHQFLPGMSDDSQVQYTSQQSPHLQQYEQGAHSHAFRAERNDVQHLPAITTYVTHQAGTVLSDPSGVKEVLMASYPLRAGSEAQGMTFKNPFAHPPFFQGDPMPDEAKRSNAVKQSPSSTPSNCEFGLAQDGKSASPDLTHREVASEPERNASVNPESKESEFAPNKRPTTRSAPVSQRGKTSRAKTPRGQPRPRVTKPKAEGRKAAGSSSKAMTKAAILDAALEDADKTDFVSVVGKEEKSEEEALNNMQTKQQQAHWRNIVKMTQSEAASWIHADTAQQTLATNTGTEVCQSTQRELEMLLRQDLAMKMQGAPSICDEMLPLEATESGCGGSLSNGHANWRQSVDTSAERLPKTQGTESYLSYDHVARMPMLSGLHSTTPLGSPSVQGGMPTVPIATSVGDNYASLMHSTSVRSSEVTGSSRNLSANRLEEAAVAEAKSLATDPAGSASGPDMMSAASAPCFLLAQERQTGELGWITDVRSNNVQPVSRFPIRPLMNGVLAQLHNEWLARHSVMPANQAASEGGEMGQEGGDGGGGSASSPAPGLFPPVQPSTESVHVRMMWRDLERRRRLFVSDPATLLELRNRAELQLRCEASYRAGLNPPTIEVLMQITDMPNDVEIATRALSMWDRARTAAAYSVGLLRQAEYCIAQSTVCFAPVRDVKRESVGVSPMEPAVTQQDKERESKQEKKQVRASGPNKRQRTKKDQCSSASDGAARSATLTSSTSVSSESGAATASNVASLETAMMRLQQRSQQAMQQ